MLKSEQRSRSIRESFCLSHQSLGGRVAIIHSLKPRDLHFESGELAAEHGKVGPAQAVEEIRSDNLRTSRGL